MANTTFGEVEWTENLSGEKKSTKDLWMRLLSGDNYIRIVTKPYQYLVHKYKKPNDPGFGQKVRCAAANGSCPLCDAGDKAKRRWLFGAIDRKTGTYKILDVGYAVMQSINSLASNTKHFGDPTKYDINIKVNPNGGATGYYTVQGIPKEPLTAEDQVLADNADLDELKRQVTPYTAEQVLKRIEKINNGDSTQAAGAQKQNVVAPQQAKPKKKVAPVNIEEDEEDDGDFPSYEQN